MRDHERVLQEDLLTAQKENLTLRFDCEQATVDLPRLKVVKIVESFIVADYLSTDEIINVSLAWLVSLAFNIFLKDAFQMLSTK